MSEARIFEPRPSLRLVCGDGRVTCDSRREPAGHPPLVLHLREAGDEVSYLVERETVRLGAHPDNEVLVDEPSTSSFHCLLVRRADGRLWVRDLGSTNGTWLDGNRVSEAEVQPGSTLRLGEALVRVELEVAIGKPPGLPGVVARDPVLAPVLELLRRAAPSHVPILLLGESGCGKEVAARAVHELSARAAGPFVPLNCGAISAELAEAELFGHERGAFTGAIGSSTGAFGAADGGTLFLDEIGDLPLGLQVKLLRALEASEIKPVGAARPRKVDVRIVCATHHDLRKRVREGAFREDLYYRIAGLSVTLPPLRARPLDILPLAESFLAEFSPETRRTLAADAREALLHHRWPGNVRELRHAIRLAVTLADGPILRRAALRLESPAAEVSNGVAQGPHDPSAAGDGQPQPSSDEPLDLRGRTLQQIEDLAIRACHARHRGNRKAMMIELGLSKSGLLRKLDQLALRS